MVCMKIQMRLLISCILSQVEKIIQRIIRMITWKESKIFIDQKSSFLLRVLNQEKISDFSVTDLGCGGGHFVKACELEQIEAIGFDTNQQLIDLGNTILESNKVYYEDLSKIDELILQNQNDVLSLVGVLEHLLEPISAIGSLFNKSSATYLYLQVPLFSLSVLLESMRS